ncbi:helix-turn-helix domain-containing protein [Paenibacillus doosanensis]|uniref:helix-turn-helix domain-containing protein n=1 Tax=Paenibacillus doosanensis TaxID=1229154 RepID=UPI00217F96F6|nr:helix-turn-helix domain-containing protein [Paenibacillus doosanensis]MCS7463406.1 helix-turn-helix domain-containing protein [Paenibacillus doosanensis]
MKKHWFKRMLLSYLPVFFFIALALIALSAISASELSKKEAVRANGVFAEHVMQMIDHTMRTIDQQMIKEVQTNEQISQFFAQYYTGNPAMTLYDVSYKLRELMINTPMIDSIYLVRSSDQIVLSNNLMASVGEFGDRDFIRQALGQGGSYKWTDVRSYKEFDDQRQPAAVVTLVKNVPLLGGRQGIIAINVQTAAIQNLVKDMTDSDVNFIRLTDRRGQPILDSKADGELLSDVTSDYTGWRVQSGLLRDNLPLFVFSYSSVWLALNLLMVVIGIVWIVYVTRRNYQPIESILARIDAYAAQRSSALSGASGQDEFRFIETALDDLVERTMTFQKQREEDLIFRKRSFFNEVIEGSRPIAREEFEEEMRLYGLREHVERTVMAVVEIDKYADFASRYNTRDQYLLKFALSSVVNEIAQNEGAAVWMEWTSSQRLSVLAHLPETEKTTERALRLFDKVRQWGSQHLDFTVTVGIGEAAASLAEVPGSYEEALEALKYKSALGGDRIIEHREIAAKSQGEVYEHLHVMRSLGQKYRLGDRDWELELEELFRELADGLFASDDIAATLHYLIYHMQREITELPGELQTVWNEEALPRLNGALERLDTILDLEREMTVILKEGFRRMEELRNARSQHPLMLRVKQYINEQYANPDLSLTHLSEEFDLNPKYVSQMFKEEFGVNFLDYLADVRIMQAKKLLMETSESVQEVGEKSGYPNVRSFMRVFKKLTGLTPGEYRKKEAG